MPSKPSLPVSTTTGDRGMTSLANGKRLSKRHQLFEVLGTQDELNSWLGLALCEWPSEAAELRPQIETIQTDLFYIGAELAHSPTAKLTTTALDNLELLSTTLQQQMGENWTTRFLYPGGHVVAARLDVARTVSRRLEREILKLSGIYTPSALVKKYVNRLSDALYVLRCYLNFLTKKTERKFVRK
jgi:cob(I)alamin adenosyltransferase